MVRRHAISTEAVAVAVVEDAVAFEAAMALDARLAAVSSLRRGAACMVRGSAALSEALAASAE